MTTMTRPKLVLATFLVLSTFGACGGRSGLKLGAVSEDQADGGGKLDGRRDATDASARDALAADARPGDLPPSPDGARTDLTDARPARDGGNADTEPPVLASLELSPVNLTIAIGIPYVGLVATAIYTDGKTTDVTESATFSSSATATVQVSGHTLTGRKAGSATITASYQDKTATAKVTVTSASLASISIEGDTVVAVGQWVPIAAIGLFTDGTKQDITATSAWKSSDPSLATITVDLTNAEAAVFGVEAGTVDITATYQGVAGSLAMTVTSAAVAAIDVTPVQPVMQKGTTRTFRATATYADGTVADVTEQATWTTRGDSIRVITTGSDGLVVRAEDTGTATITATFGGIRGSTTVTVTAPTLTAIAVTPSTWTPNVGGTQSFTASGTYSDGSSADLTLSVTWASTAANVVAVSNASDHKGQATALATGSAQIQATLSGVTGSASVKVSASLLASVTVTPNPVSVVLGLSAALVATATYENGVTEDVTEQAAWTVANGDIASVSNAAGSAGRITGLAAGDTRVSATYGGKSGTAAVSVAQTKLTAITISPETASVSAGRTQQFTATGIYDNGTSVDLTADATWASTDVTVAQVSNATGSRGLATALSAGTVKITATFGGINNGAVLTVGEPLLASITITPSAASVEVGRNQQFAAQAVYENGTTGPLQGETWISSNTSIATITSQGPRTVATGVAPGTVTITVSYQGKSASATLVVTAGAVLVQITVTPQMPPSILVGDSQQFRATAVYGDGTTDDITNAVNWTTSDGTVATITNASARDGGRPGGGNNAGLATGVGAGTATITAAYAGTCTVSCTATSSLTVRNPSPKGLAITPTSATIRVGDTQQFVALLLYDDGTSDTLTNGVSWTTSDGAVASISTANGGRPGGGRGNEGLATGLAAGTVKITATYQDFTATASLTVVAAKPTALVVTPAFATITINTTQVFVATLAYDDGTTAVVTGQADWSSSDVSIATVSSGGGQGGGRPGNDGGVATALGVGAATITASYGGFTATATLTVTDPPIAYVQVTPTNPNLPVGASQQLTATAVFTDFSSRDVTAQATWSSSSASVAVVTTSGRGAGRASALVEGTATISASYSGFSGTTLLTVAKGIKSISVVPTNPTTVLGVSVRFTATATLTNDASLVVTGDASWVTSDASVATVTANGTATPLKAGAATITAAYLGVSGSSKLTVSAASLSAITLSPGTLSLASGASAQLMATGTYGDGASYDLTPFATWLSSSTTVATVSNANGSRGLLTTLAPGSTSVTAVFQGTTSSSLPVTVTE